MRSINRRQFLGTIGAAGAFSIISARKSMASNDTIRIGIMGLGGRGQFLTDHFARRPDIEVVYLCDVNRRRFAYAR